jgi:hypothetical protein
MAILDVFGRVATSKAITGAGVAGLFFSDSIDVSATGLVLRDLGRGNKLTARFEVTEAFVTSTGARLLWHIVVATNDDSGFFNSSPVFLTRSPVDDTFANLAAAKLALGNQYLVPIPPIPQHELGASAGRRYLGVVWQLNDANQFTAGKMTVDIGIHEDLLKPPVFRSGYTGP